MLRFPALSFNLVVNIPDCNIFLNLVFQWYIHTKSKTLFGTVNKDEQRIISSIFLQHQLEVTKTH
jgi:hypothetical protein